MRKILSYSFFVFAIVLAVVIGYLQYKEAGEITSDIVKPTLIVMASVSGFATAVSKEIKLRKTYKTAFKNDIREAFTGKGEKRRRNKLIKAILLHKQEKYSEALKILNSLIPHCKTDDDYHAVYMLLAETYIKLDDTANTEKAYKELISHNDRDSVAHSNLGMFYSKNERYDEAAAELKTAALYDRNNPYAYNNTAHLLLRMGKYEDSIMYAEIALKLKPNLYQASCALAISHLAMGNEELSQKYADMSVKDGEDYESLKEVLECIRKGNNPFGETFTPLYKKAIEKFTEKTTVPYSSVAYTSDISRSRIGGAVIGTAPLDSEGKPMAMLCAVYCSDVKGVPDFPEKGLLRFFVSDNDMMGADFDNPTSQKDFKVIYTERENLPEIPAKVPECLPMLNGPVGLSFSPAKGPMTSDDDRFDEEFRKVLADIITDGTTYNNGLWERFYSEGSRIGGYPHFCQYDPRADRTRYGKYDTLLLQIDSDDSHIMIGDLGVMNFFIEREKLRKRDFSDVLYWWDCY